MTSEADKENSTLLSPDEAFAVLGNETRIQILRVLGRADAPLAFSDGPTHRWRSRSCTTGSSTTRPRTSITTSTNS